MFYSKRMPYLHFASTRKMPMATAGDSTSTSSLPNHTPVIIGGVIAGVAIIFIIGATLLCLRYRTRRDTSIFAQTKMLRLHDSVPLSSQWSASPVLEKDLEYYPSSPTKTNALRPQDSVSNIYFLPPILPPIPAARSGTISDVPSPMSISSSVQRTRKESKNE